MIAFWVLIIGGEVWLVMTLARNQPGLTPVNPAAQTPLAILQTRYAKGEITKEQFEQMQRDLA